MPIIGDTLQHNYNVLYNKDPPKNDNLGNSYSMSPMRTRISRGNERSIINTIFNRIALDCASFDIIHVKTDDDDRYLEDYSSKLNECLKLDPNIDQTSDAFKQEVVLNMLTDGHVAVVPVETTLNPYLTGGYDILELRAGKIVQWYPDHVKVNLYNGKTGHHDEVILPKSYVAIITNPFYSVMNEPNSTAQRLMRKMSMMDLVDEQSCSDKMNLIIQLPYLVKSDARKKQAELRRQAIEDQLMKNKYGIAYIDGSEHVTQLNRPIDNNLMSQVEYYTSMLFSQLGMTTGVLDGTADEQTMNNYYGRICEPIVSAIVLEYKRKFLTKTARTQHQSIMFFRNPFKLVTVNNVAEVSDKLTRNEIATSNEIRQIIGFKPSKDPNADKLLNKNINHPSGKDAINGLLQNTETETKEKEENQNE